MSKYMELKAEIDAKMAQLAQLREEERDAEITDIKKRVIAFEIGAEAIYSRDDLKLALSLASKRTRTESQQESDRRIRFRYEDAFGKHEWNARGNVPKWMRRAIESGIPIQTMLVEGEKMPQIKALQDLVRQHQGGSPRAVQ